MPTNDRTHCVHDHELADDNVVVRHGRRVCRTCEKANGARYRAKRSQAAGGGDPAGSDGTPGSA